MVRLLLVRFCITRLLTGFYENDLAELSIEVFDDMSLIIKFPYPSVSLYFDSYSVKVRRKLLFSFAFK